MYNIKTLNKIAKCGLSQLDDNYKIADDIENPEAMILRSFSMHDMELPTSLLAVARAGAGVNNIPLDKCSEKGIVVFNTPGANANAVKELVIAGMLLSSRKIVDGIQWATTLENEADNVPKAIEKGKSAFVGPEILGKTLGVIGLGAIGVMVANAAVSLGMDVIGFDPFISVDAAWGLSPAVKRAANAKEVYENSDYLTLHLPLNDNTKNMINDEVFATAKKGLRLLNFARGGLVSDKDVLKAIDEKIVSCYVTDFPDIKMINKEGVIAIPHLGASTPESEDNCAIMAAKELKEYLEFGNIINSVNFPNVTAEVATKHRVCVTHKNVPNMLSPISAAFSAESINIMNMTNKSRGDYAYTIIDVESVNDKSIEAIKNIKGVLSVRTINF